MFEGVRRHWEVWKESYRLDKEQKRTATSWSDADFLPAALEVLERPASPIGRTLMLLILLFFAIAFLWSVWGQVDVVASAQGKIIPYGNIKVIQPAELGVVRGIHVENGGWVKAGDMLIELDPTISAADEARARRELAAARIVAARDRAILSGIDAIDADPTLVRLPPLDLAADTPDNVELTQRALVRAALEEYRAGLAGLIAQRQEREAERRVVNQEIAKLEETLPLLEEQVDARAGLVEKGLSPRFQFLEYKERLVGQRRDLAIQRDRLTQIDAALRATDQQIAELKEQARRERLTELAEAEEQAAALTQELAKAAQRSELQKLTAPIDGTVQQLAVHTVGGVVQAGDPVMVIVPAGTTLELEAMVLNKDIGFVHEGQAVEIKLEAFPFTKYGVIDGEVAHIARDAVNDENLGLVYPTRILMKEATIRVAGKPVPLGPGMAATAEIKTGKRRLIEFFLAPLLRYKSEALRER